MIHVCIEVCGKLPSLVVYIFTFKNRRLRKNERDEEKMKKTKKSSSFLLHRLLVMISAANAENLLNAGLQN